MRIRILLILTVAAAAVGVMPAQPAHAAVIDAQTFVGNDYCGSGGFGFGGTLKVIGGTGVLPGNCEVTLSNDAQVSFKNVTLSGPASFVVHSGANSTVTITQSEIEVGSTLLIGPGYGGSYPAGAGDGGTAKIVGSTLVGVTVEIYPSCDANDGTAEIKKSLLDGAQGGVVIVGASDPTTCGGTSTGGTINATKTEFDANDSFGSLTLSTGAGGSTKVAASDLLADTTVIHSGGTCVSKKNSPDTACS